MSRRAKIGWGIVVIAIGLWGQGLPSAQAQTAEEKSFKADPVDPAFVLPVESDFNLNEREQRREFTNKKTEVNRARKAAADTTESVLSGGADLNAGRAEVTRYLNGLLFPELTGSDSDSLFRLAERRENLVKMIRNAPAGSPTREFLLTEAVLPAMSRIAGDVGYHPAVRLNALVILGELNEREGVRGGSPPKPLAAATQFLLQIAGDANNPNYLRIGALSGLVRQADLDGQEFVLTQGATSLLNDAERTAMINLGCQLVEDLTAADIQKLSDEQYWMARQAVQMLGGLGRPGEGGKVVTTLRKLLENSQTPTLLMADSVAAYGGLQFADPAQADAAQVAALIGRFVSAALVAEAKAIDDYLYQIKEKRLFDSKTTEAKAAAIGGSAEDDSSTSGGNAGGGGMAGGRGKRPAGANKTAGASGSIVFPNYMINDIRQRAKTLIFIGRVALDGTAPRRKSESKPPENLKKFADEPTQQAIAKLVAVLDRLMDETSLATKSPLTGDAASEGLEQRLKTALEGGSADLDRVVETMTPKTGS